MHDTHDIVQQMWIAAMSVNTTSIKKWIPMWLAHVDFETVPQQSQAVQHFSSPAAGA
jgi:bifunctional pyridoxal-dependent enzyme with beta-cystathionase and maltose regulon repressor activities